MAYNRIGKATTEPFVSCDCVPIVDIVSFVRTSQRNTAVAKGQHIGFVSIVLLTYNFCKKEKIKSLNRQFREIKFPANTIFLRDRKSKRLAKFAEKIFAKIKENKVFHKLHLIDAGSTFVTTLELSRLFFIYSMRLRFDVCPKPYLS